MKFVQIIEFKTSRIDEFNDVLDAAIAKSAGRTPHRVVHTKDRDTEDLYALILEFPSQEKAMENSNRPESAEFAASLANLCDGPLMFRNLDMLREENLWVCVAEKVLPVGAIPRGSRIRRRHPGVSVSLAEEETMTTTIKTYRIPGTIDASCLGAALGRHNGGPHEGRGREER